MLVTREILNIICDDFLHTLGSFPLLEHLNLGVLLGFMSKFHFNNLSYHTKNRLLNQPIDNDEPKILWFRLFLSFGTWVMIPCTRNFAPTSSFSFHKHVIHFTHIVTPIPKSIFVSCYHLSSTFHFIL
jgi:hypothetical protein